MNKVGEQDIQSKEITQLFTQTSTGTLSEHPQKMWIGCGEPSFHPSFNAAVPDIFMLSNLPSPFEYFFDVYEFPTAAVISY